VLEIPPFRPNLPWLSLTGAESDAGGVADEGPVDRAMALADAIVEGRLGGSCWAAAPAVAGWADDEGSGLAVVGACGARAGAAVATLRRVCRSAGAGRTVVLLPAGAGAAARRRIGREVRALGCRMVCGPADPWPLLDRAATVHVEPGCACQHGFGTLALLAGVALHRGGRVLAGAAERARAAVGLITATAYADPFTGESCTAERALELVRLWKEVCAANRGIAACVGVQFWKRRRVSQFLHTGTGAPRFVRGTAAVATLAAGGFGGGAVAGWASRLPAGLAEAAEAAGVRLLRIEDGFVRSVGLGSDFNVPCSIVVDSGGLYYDPSRASDLETLLATHAFPPALLARARAVVDRLVDGGTTKYGSGTGGLPALPADGRRRILVPGQVADDLSVRLGAGAASSNGELLEKVRAANPGAYIVYRPHPDVEAGHRPGALDDAAALQHADVIVRGGAMAALIGAVDEVHTMTSLAGFEALLRGRRVVVYGRPFYAGWGLTTDLAPILRRGRALSIEALAAGVLLLYPRYLDPMTGLPCPVEVLLDRMADPAVWRAGPLVRVRRLQGRLAVRLRKIMGGRAERAAS
jgi:capsular polysaccharide export protein